MQKLIALYLSNYTADRMLHEDGDKREYLEDQLKLGWRVVSVTPLGSVAPDNGPTSTWAMVLLEKTPPPTPSAQSAAQPKQT
jgi:hypothetical protein